ncbi:MAG: isochorismatase family protein [Pirellulales bacterium]
MTDNALIVIDVQNDYFSGGRWELSGMDAAAKNVGRLLDAARKRGDLVVHIRHEFPTADAPFFARFGQRANSPARGESRRRNGDREAGDQRVPRYRVESDSRPAQC